MYIVSSVTYIGKDAFYNCNSLENVIMPTLAINYIPKTNLKTLVLTSGESIDENAFENCSGLLSVTIPARVRDNDLHPPRVRKNTKEK